MRAIQSRRAGLIIAVAGFLCACNDSTRAVSPPDPVVLPVPVQPIFGTIEVSVTTVATDDVGKDPDGYMIFGLGEPTRIVAPEGSVTFARVPSGTYAVLLSGLEGGCQVVSQNPIVIRVAVDTALSVAFQVACERPAEFAFVRYYDNGADIYVGYGNVATRLTSGSGWNDSPAWSPDGKRIAFVSSRDGNDEIYTMDADGRNQVRLTTTPGEDLDPAWSPDGTRIAFTSRRDLFGDTGNRSTAIYTMNADGTSQSVVTSLGAIDREPTWSPDGTRIAFASNRDESFGIWLINVDGSALTRMTSQSRPESNPVWPPDGTRIAFERYTPIYYARYQALLPLKRVFIMNADGSDVHQLTAEFLFFVSMHPTWSPSGGKIAFTSLDDPNTDLRLVGL